MSIPVSEVFRLCHKMLDEQWGYIWGTAGEMWTQAKQSALEAKYSPDDPNRGNGVKYGSKWIGRMVTDCSGAIVYIYKQFGLTIPHGSSSMVSRGYIVDCSDTPKPGYAALVDPTPNTPDNRHIGIVLEDGVTVFEASGTIAGCITSKVTDKKWTKFGRFKAVDYTGSESPKEVIKLNTPYTAKVTTQSGGLNIRKTANGAKIGLIPQNAICTVLEHGSEWDKVQYGTLTGYCATRYLSPIEEIGGGSAPATSVDTAELAKIKSEISSLKSTINTVNSKLTSLETKINNL